MTKTIVISGANLEECDLLVDRLVSQGFSVIAAVDRDDMLRLLETREVDGVVLFADALEPAWSSDPAGTLSEILGSRRSRDHSSLITIIVISNAGQAPLALQMDGTVTSYQGRNSALLDREVAAKLTMCLRPSNGGSYHL